MITVRVRGKSDLHVLPRVLQQQINSNNNNNNDDNKNSNKHSNNNKKQQQLTTTTTTTVKIRQWWRLQISRDILCISYCTTLHILISKYSCFLNIINRGVGLSKCRTVDIFLKEPLTFCQWRKVKYYSVFNYNKSWTHWQYWKLFLSERH